MRATVFALHLCLSLVVCFNTTNTVQIISPSVFGFHASGVGAGLHHVDYPPPDDTPQARRLQTNSPPTWAFPAPTYALQVPDLTAVGALVVSMSASDPDPQYSIFGQLSYSIVAVTPAWGSSYFTLAASTGKLTFAQSPMGVWRGAPRATTGIAFTLTVRATDCNGGSLGLNALPYDAVLNITIMPSYFPSPCAPFTKLGWAIPENRQGLFNDYNAWPTGTNQLFPNWKTAPFNPPGSNNCYYRLEQYVSGDYSFLSRLCGSTYEGGNLATIQSEAEANYVVGQQCGWGPIGSSPPLPSSALGVATGLYAGIHRTAYSDTFNVRNAAGSLPQVWGWFQSPLDTIWIRSAAATSWWASGHPLSGLNPWTYVDGVTNKLMTFNGGGGFLGCCSAPAVFTPAIATPPILSPGFTIPTTPGVPVAVISVASTSPPGTLIANLSTWVWDGDDKSTPAGTIFYTLLAAFPSLPAFNAAFNLTSTGLLLTLAPPTLTPPTYSILYNFTVLPVDGLGLQSPTNLTFSILLTLPPFPATPTLLNTPPKWALGSALNGTTTSSPTVSLTIPQSSPTGTAFLLPSAWDTDVAIAPTPPAPPYYTLVYSVDPSTPLPAWLTLNATGGVLVVSSTTTLATLLPGTTLPPLIIRVADGTGAQPLASDGFTPITPSLSIVIGPPSLTLVSTAAAAGPPARQLLPLTGGGCPPGWAPSPSTQQCFAPTSTGVAGVFTATTATTTRTLLPTTGWGASSPLQCPTLYPNATLAYITSPTAAAAATAACGVGAWVKGVATWNVGISGAWAGGNGSTSAAWNGTIAGGAAGYAQYAAHNPLTGMNSSGGSPPSASSTLPPGGQIPTTLFDFSLPGTIRGMMVTDVMGRGDGTAIGLVQEVDDEKERAGVSVGGSILASMATATGPGGVLSTGLQIRLLANDPALAVLPENAPVNVWESFWAPTPAFPTSPPKYRSAGGPYGMPTVNFDGMTNCAAAGNVGQWMVRNASMRFRSRSNGGFAIAGIFRMTPGVNVYERLFDFTTTSSPGSGGNGLGNLLLARLGNTDVLSATVYNPFSGAGQSVGNDGPTGLAASLVQQGNGKCLKASDASYCFLVINCQLNGTTSTWDWYVKGGHSHRSQETLSTAVNADPLADRTFFGFDGNPNNYNMRLGRSSWNPDAMLSGDISALLIWDRPLTPSELAALHTAMLPRSTPTRTFGRLAGGYSFIQLPTTTVFATVEMWVRMRPPSQQPSPSRTQGMSEGPYLFDAGAATGPPSLFTPAFVSSGVTGTMLNVALYVKDYDPVIDNGTVIQAPPDFPGGPSNAFYLTSFGLDRAFGDMVSTGSAGFVNGVSLPSLYSCAQQCNRYATCNVLTVHTRKFQDAEGSTNFNCWSKAALAPAGVPQIQADMWAARKLASGYAGLSTLGATLYVDGAPAPFVRQSIFQYDNQWHHVVVALTTPLSGPLVLFARNQNGGNFYLLGNTYFQKFGLAVDVGEVRLYGSTLNAADVAARYRGSVGKWGGATYAPETHPLPSFPQAFMGSSVDEGVVIAPTIWYNFGAGSTLRGGGVVHDSSPSSSNATLGMVAGGRPMGARAAFPTPASPSGYMAFGGGQNSGLSLPPDTPQLGALEFTLRSKSANAGALFPPPLYPELTLIVSKPFDGTNYFNVADGACSAPNRYNTYDTASACALLNIQEVQAYSAPGGLFPPGTIPSSALITSLSNRAFRMPCAMSSILGGYPCDLAVDGVVTIGSSTNFAHTAVGDPAPWFQVQLKGYEPMGLIVYTPRTSASCGGGPCAFRSNQSLISLVPTAAPNVTLFSTRLVITTVNPNADQYFDATGRMPISPAFSLPATGPTLLDTALGVAGGSFIFEPRPVSSGTPATASIWRPGFENATLYVDGVSLGTGWSASDLFRHDNAWHHFAIVPPTPLVGVLPGLRLFGRAVGGGPNRAFQSGADKSEGNFTSAGLACDVLEVRLYSDPLTPAQVAARAAIQATLTGSLAETLDNTTVRAVRRFRYNCTSGASPTQYTTYTVPSGINALRVHLWGAGGGAGVGINTNNRNPGGGGAYVTGRLAVTPGSTLSLVLGKGGSQVDVSTATAGTVMGPNSDVLGGGGFSRIGGAASVTGADVGSKAGSGGGRSAIRMGGVGGFDLVTAGGGGGGYNYNIVTPGSTGGAGGVFSGYNAGNSIGVTGVGLGGSVSAGGASIPDSNYVGHSAPATAASCPGGLGFGGCANPWWWGGGGGGGWWGGSGGVDGGGGGGSSNPFSLTLVSWQDGFQTLAGGQDDPFYEPGVGVGGQTAMSGLGVNPNTWNGNGGNAGGWGWQHLTSSSACTAASVGSGGPGMIIIEELGAMYSWVSPTTTTTPPQPGGVLSTALRVGVPPPITPTPWSLSRVTGPSLTLWLDPAVFVGLPSGTAMNSWPNRGATALSPVATTPAQAPLVRAGALNGWPVLTFSAASFSQLGIGTNTALAPVPRYATLNISFPWTYLVVARMSGTTNLNRIISQALSTSSGATWLGPWHGGWMRRFVANTLGASGVYQTPSTTTGTGVFLSVQNNVGSGSSPPPTLPGPQPNGTVPALADTLWHTYIVTHHSPTSLSAWEDGVLLGRNMWQGGGGSLVPVSLYGAPDGITLNGPGQAATSASATTEWSDCEVGEVMLWSGAEVSDYDVAGLHTYVQTKFGLPLGGVGGVDGGGSSTTTTTSNSPLPPVTTCLSTTGDGGGSAVGPRDCRLLAPTCCSIPLVPPTTSSTTTTTTPNSPPIWTSIVSGDGTQDSTGSGNMTLILPHLSPLGTVVAVVKASDGDSPTTPAGVISYSFSPTTPPALAALLTLTPLAGGGVSLALAASLTALAGAQAPNCLQPPFTLVARDGGGATPTQGNVTLTLCIALSYRRPLRLTPTMIRVSRPGYDRMEVGEIGGFTPSGTNVALGSLVSSTDPHFGWGGVGEVWGPTPAFIATNGIERDYASVFLGSTFSEPTTTTTTGVPAGTFAPTLDVLLGAPTELAYVSVTLRQDCTPPTSTCYPSTVGFRVSVLGLSPVNGSVIELGAMWGPGNAGALLPTSPLILPIPYQSPLNFSSSAVAIDTPPTLNTSSITLTLSDLTALGTQVLLPTAVATDADPPVVPAGNISFANLRLLSPLPFPSATAPFPFTLTPGGGALAVNGSIATLMLAGTYLVTLALQVVDGLGLPALSSLTVTLQLSATSTSSVYTCPPGWVRPPSSSNCYALLTSTTPPLFPPQWATQCSNPAAGGVARGGLAVLSNDAEAQWVIASTCGLNGGRSRAFLSPATAGAGALYAIGVNATGAWPGVVGGSGSGGGWVTSATSPATPSSASAWLSGAGQGGWWWGTGEPGNAPPTLPPPTNFGGYYCTAAAFSAPFLATTPCSASNTSFPTGYAGATPTLRAACCSVPATNASLLLSNNPPTILGGGAALGGGGAAVPAPSSSNTVLLVPVGSGYGGAVISLFAGTDPDAQVILAPPPPAPQPPASTLTFSMTLSDTTLLPFLTLSPLTGEVTLGASGIPLSRANTNVTVTGVAVDGLNARSPPTSITLQFIVPTSTAAAVSSPPIPSSSPLTFLSSAAAAPGTPLSPLLPPSSPCPPGWSGGGAGSMWCYAPARTGPPTLSNASLVVTSAYNASSVCATFYPGAVPAGYPSPSEAAGAGGICGVGLGGNTSVWLGGAGDVNGGSLFSTTNTGGGGGGGAWASALSPFSSSFLSSSSSTSLSTAVGGVWGVDANALVAGTSQFGGALASSSSTLPATAIRAPFSGFSSGGVAVGTGTNTPPSTVLTSRNPNLLTWLSLPATSVLFQGQPLARWPSLVSSTYDFTAPNVASRPTTFTQGAPPGCGFVTFSPTAPSQSLTVANTLPLGMGAGLTIFLLARVRPGSPGATLVDTLFTTSGAPWFAGGWRGLQGVVFAGGAFATEPGSGRVEAGGLADGTWHLLTISMGGFLAGNSPATLQVWMDGARLSGDNGATTCMSPQGRLCLGACTAGANTFATPDMDVGELAVFTGLWRGGGLPTPARIDVESHIMAKWGITPQGYTANASGGFPTPTVGHCLSVNASTGVASVGDCTAPRGICCALGRGGMVAQTPAPFWTGATAVVVAAWATAGVDAGAVRAAVPILTLPPFLTATPVGTVLGNVTAFPNAGPPYNTLNFTVPGGPSSALPFALSPSGVITLARPVTAPATFTFSIQAVNGFGASPTLAPIINVTLTALLGYSFSCPLPTVQRVRFIMGAGTPAALPVVSVKEAQILDGRGLPLPASNISVVALTGRQGGTFVQGLEGGAGILTPSCVAPACTTASLSQLFDGVINSYTSTALVSGTPTGGRVFIEVSLNSDAGAAISSLLMYYSSVNVNGAFAAAALPLPWTYNQAEPSPGGWMELWTASASNSLGRPFWTSPLVPDLPPGTPANNFSLVFSVDIRAQGCTSPTVAAALTTLTPFLTLAAPTSTTWYFINSPPTLAFGSGLVAASSTTTTTTTTSARVVALSIVASPSDWGIYLFGSYDATGLISLANFGDIVTMGATDVDVGSAGAVNLTLTGVGSGDFTFTPLSQTGSTTLYALKATTQLAFSRQGFYNLTCGAVDGLFASATPTLTLLLTIVNSYLDIPSSNTWRMETAPAILSDLTFPNNALRIPENSPLRTPLPLLLQGQDIDTPTVPAGIIVSFSVAVTGFIPTNSTAILPIGAWASSSLPVSSCGTLPCGTTPALFSGTVLGRNAVTGIWSLGISYVNGTLDFEAVAVYILTLVVTDGLGLSDTRMGVPLFVGNANDPVSLLPTLSPPSGTAAGGAGAGAVVPAWVVATGGGGAGVTFAPNPPTTPSSSTSLLPYVVDQDTLSPFSLPTFAFAGNVTAVNAPANFYASSSSSSLPSSLFTLDPAKGTLTLTSPLLPANYPPASLPSLYFLLNLTVSDFSYPPSSFTFTVNLTLQQGNVPPLLNASIGSGGGGGGGDGSALVTGTIPENSAVGTPVTLIGPPLSALVTDGNTGGLPPAYLGIGYTPAWSNLTFSLSPSDSNLVVSWVVDGVTGVVRFGGSLLSPPLAPSQALNFEDPTSSTYRIRVRVSDGGGLYTEVVVVVGVSDVNEPPTFLASSLLDTLRTFPEAVNGTTPPFPYANLQLSPPLFATDPDGPATAYGIPSLTWSTSGAQFCGGVGASPWGGGSTSSTTPLLGFPNNGTSASVTLAQAMAWLTLAPGATATDFLTPSTLDFETLGEWGSCNVSVCVRDGGGLSVCAGSGGGGSGAGGVTVSVQDQNDPPVLLLPATPPTLSIPEATPVGTPIATLAATDQDGDVMAWSVAWAPGSPASSSSSSPIMAIPFGFLSPGVLSTVLPLSYNATVKALGGVLNGTLPLLISVRDGGKPTGVSATTFALYNVTITPSAGYGSMALGSSNTVGSCCTLPLSGLLTIPENATGGTVVGVVGGSDPDPSGTPAGTVMYSFSPSDTEAAPFSIGLLTGVIYVNPQPPSGTPPLDWESKAAWYPRVIIRDATLAPLSTSMVVTINLTDSPDTTLTAVTSSGFPTLAFPSSGDTPGAPALLTVLGTNLGPTLARYASSSPAIPTPTFVATYGPFTTTCTPPPPTDPTVGTTLTCPITPGYFSPGMGPFPLRITIVYPPGSVAGERAGVGFGATQPVASPGISYLPPSLSGVSVVGGGGVIPTTGGGQFALSGSNFGPTGTPWNLSYTHSSGGALYTTSCSVTTTPHTSMTCATPVGVGGPFLFTLFSPTSHLLPASTTLTGSTLLYSPPVISTVSTSPTLLPTNGTGTITLVGSGFGPLTSGSSSGGIVLTLSSTWSSSGTAWLPTAGSLGTTTFTTTTTTTTTGTSTPCRVTVADTTIVCVGGLVGMGATLSAQVTVGGQGSNAYPAPGSMSAFYVAYAPPSITGMSGPAWEAPTPTTGGSELVITGANFGVNPGTVSATYGQPPGGNAYAALSCYILTPHTSLACIMGPGSGRGLVWSVTVGGQSSGATPSVPSLTTSYLPPTLSSVAASTSTAGQVVVVGGNFGPPTLPSSLLSLSYTAPTLGTNPLVSIGATACTHGATLPHTTLLCTIAMVGDLGVAQVVWSVVVDGQASSQPQYQCLNGTASGSNSSGGGGGVVVGSSVTSSPTLSPTPTPTPTSTISATPSASSTLTASSTPSLTQGASASNTPSTSLSGSTSQAPSLSPSTSILPTPSTTTTPSPSPTPTPTSTATLSPTSSPMLSGGGGGGGNSPSSTPTPTPTSSLTNGASGSTSSTNTLTASPTATPTPSVSLGLPASTSSTSTLTASPSPTPSSSITLGASASTSSTSTLSASPTGTPTASLTTGVSSSSTSTSTLSSSPTSTPTPSVSVGASASTSSTGTLSASPSGTPTASLTSGVSPSSTSTSSLTSSPTATPSSSVTLGALPSTSSTSTLTSSPTSSPTPSLSRGQSPSTTSTSSLTSSPSQTPTSSLSPGASPSTSSSTTLSGSPTITPTSSLSVGLSPSTTSTSTLSGSPTSSPTQSLSLGASPSTTPTPTPTPTSSSGGSGARQVTPTPTPTPSSTKGYLGGGAIAAGAAQASSLMGSAVADNVYLSLGWGVSVAMGGMVYFLMKKMAIMNAAMGGGKGGKSSSSSSSSASHSLSSGKRSTPLSSTQRGASGGGTVKGEGENAFSTSNPLRTKKRKG